jgi:hypothetical protein
MAWEHHTNSHRPMDISKNGICVGDPKQKNEVMIIFLWLLIGSKKWLISFLAIKLVMH